METAALIRAAKVPRSLLPWKGENGINAMEVRGDAFLFDAFSLAGMHLVDDDGFGGYTVMDDSDPEIRRHLPAIHAARGRVLKTGLGFGCFVRACLQKPDVEHIDVVEIDRSIIDHFGREFRGNPRVTIHHADAFKFRLAGRHWSLGWHDIYCDGNHGLQELHLKLLRHYAGHCDQQGAWGLPHFAARLWNTKMGQRLIGSPAYRRAA